MNEHADGIRQNWNGGDNLIRLHLCCGGHLLSGWHNTDLNPQSSEVRRLDVTQPFPLHDNYVDYIFREHEIEHLTYQQGLFSLRECFRVLKPGGKLRITTPDLAWLTQMHQTQVTQSPDSLSSADVRYIDRAHRDDPRAVPIPNACCVLNNFVRMYAVHQNRFIGHVFIYDKLTLKHSLAQVGFHDDVITEHLVCQSDDPELRNLEHVDRLPAGELQLESFTLEAIKW